MKCKVVPEPRPLSFIGEVQRALPLVPGDQEDCCARLVDRTDLSRAAAREWIPFLQALGLAEETSSGFRRLRREPENLDLARAFRDGIFGVEIVLDTLAAADEPLGVEAVFERFRHRVPNWERHRRRNWAEQWHERVRRLLDWTVAVGLTERVGERYRAV